MYRRTDTGTERGVGGWLLLIVAISGLIGQVIGLVYIISLM